MRFVFAFVAFMALTGCLPGQEPRQVIVDGTARLEFEPEVFRLDGVIGARGDNRESVLRDVSEKLNSVQETLPALEGLTHLDVGSRAMRISPVFDGDCSQQRSYESPDSCPVVGYFGSIALVVKGAPADRAGAAFSLLSELGAESITLGAYDVRDRKAVQQQAIDAAVNDARLKADSVAAAAGASVTRLLRVQHGGGFGDLYGGRDVFFHQMKGRDLVVVNAQRDVSPAVDLSLEPQPIFVEAEVVAAFAIE